MKYIVILPYYLVWHYSRGFYDLIVVLKDFFIFVLHFFSVRTLTKTFFHPLYGNIINSNKINLSKVFIINFLARIWGIFVRLFVILVGLFSSLLTLFVAVCLVSLWLFLPFILAFSFGSALFSLFIN